MHFGAGYGWPDEMEGVDGRLQRCRYPIGTTPGARERFTQDRTDDRRPCTAKELSQCPGSRTTDGSITRAVGSTGLPAGWTDLRAGSTGLRVGSTGLRVGSTRPPAGSTEPA